MRHYYRITPILFLGLCLLLTSCEEATGPADPTAERPAITGFQITPSTLQFTTEDGFGDTLVVFHIDVQGKFGASWQVVAEIAGIRDREIRTSDTLTSAADGSGRHSGSIALLMNTNRFENLVAYVYPVAPDGSISDRMESTIKVRGIDTGVPDVLDIMHPEAVRIPLPGEPDNRFTISAAVTHTLSLENINTVHLTLFDRTGDDIFSSTMRNAGTEADSVPPFRIYEQDFRIDSNNSPENYQIKVHAVDIAGTVSDTLRSTLIITR